MPRLKDLEAELIWKLEPDGAFSTDCTDVSQAQGLWFLCPKCFRENGNSNVGTHHVLCWFNGRGVPPDMDPKPGRWNPQGNTIDDLTFVGPGAFSVLLTAGCNWHGFVTNGAAE